MEDMVSVAEAAKMIGLSPNQIRLHLKAGRLAGKFLGTYWVVDKAAAEAFKRADRPKGRPPRRGRKVLRETLAEGAVDALTDYAEKRSERRADVLARFIIHGIETDPARKPKRKK